MDTETAKRSRAILYMVLATFAFAVMSALAKAAKGLAPFGSLVCVRSAVTLLVVMPWIWFKGVSFVGANRKSLVLRSLLGFTALSLFMFTVQNLPLSSSAILQQTSVLFVPILSFLVLRENVTRDLFAAVAIAFMGVLLVIRPSATGDFVPWITGLMAAMASAGAYVTVRSMSGKEDPLTVVAYFGAMSLIGSIIFLDGLNIPFNSSESMLIIIGSGLAGTAGQVLLTTSLLLAPASIVAPFNFCGVLFATAIGTFFWGETLDVMTVIGMAIIISVGIAIQRGYVGQPVKAVCPTVSTQ